MRKLVNIKGAYKFFDNDSTDASINLFISLKFAFGYFSLNLLKENLISSTASELEMPTLERYAKWNQV